MKHRDKQCSASWKSNQNKATPNSILLFSLEDLLTSGCLLPCKSSSAYIGLYHMCVKQCKGVERPVSRSVYSFIAFVELRLSSAEKQQPHCCLFRHLNDWWKLLERTAALESRLTLIREKDVHIPPPTYTQRRGLKSWPQSFSNCHMLRKNATPPIG